jgi:ribosomal protein L37AE/L43A
MNTYQDMNESLSAIFDIECSPINLQDIDLTGDIIGQWGKDNIMYGRKHSPETKAKMSETLKTMPHIIGRPGELNGMYGRKHSDAAKKVMSEKRRATNLAKKNEGIDVTRAMNVIKQCPHCGKETTTGNYARWHGINCKERTQPVLSSLC